MNAKTSMVLIALIGVGLFALPQTTALFAGQHSFTNIDATGNQIECVKCHGDVQAELGTQGYSATTNTSGPHASFKCEYCHRIEAGAASGDNAYGYAAYTNAAATKKRLLVLTMADFEEEKFPGSAKYPAVTLTMDDTLATLQTKMGVNFTADHGTPMASLSPATVGDTEVLTLQQEREAATYAGGVPRDTNSTTKDTGFAPQNIIVWTAPSYLPADSRKTWTFGWDGVGSKAVNPGSEYHAASLVSCLECHGGAEPFGHYSRVLDGTNPTGTANSCPDCHYGGQVVGNRWTELGAGGFGFLGGADTGKNEAHKEFQTTGDNITRSKTVNGLTGSNGACVACHTHVAVDITYTKPTTYQFNANFGTNGNETLNGFAATGTNTTHS